MKVKLDINIPKVIREKLDDKAKLFLANTAYKLMNDYVPMDTGTLSQTATGHPPGDANITPEYIHYRAKYAEEVYEGDGRHFNTNKHSLATSRWDKAMLAARKDKLVQTMQNYFKKRGW